MKALLRNNFYTVEPSIKTSGVISLIGIIALIGFGLFSSQGASTMALSYVSFAIMGSFAGLSFTLLFNNSKSKWERFELTAPVTRVDVIKCRYISFLIFCIIGLAIGGTIFLLSSVINGVIDWDFFSRGIIIGILLLILAPAIMHPLILKFGIEKGQPIFMISVALSIGVYALPSLVFNSWFAALPNQELANIIYRAITILFSFIMFIVSYFISVKIYAKQDL